MISAPGIGSGLDVQAIVSQLMAIERQPLQVLQRKQGQYEAQLSAYGQLNSALSTFQTAMSDLGSLSKFKVFTSTSAAPETFTAIASSSATAGSFDIEVVRRAEHHKFASSEFINTDTFGGTAGDALTIQVGSDPLDAINVDLSTAQTLAQIRDVINDDTANPGVTATIINGDAGNQKLVLTSNDSGQANALSLSYGGAVNATTFGFQTVNDIGGDLSLLDAELVVDGYTMTRASNSINDVISGVTLDLLSEAPGTANTLTIDEDIEAVTESVQAFVDAYNELRSTLDSLRKGQLEADSTILSIGRQVLGEINTPASGGAYGYLSEIGVSMQKDGTMTLSSTDLESVLKTDYSAVADLFAADGQGYANRLGALTDNWLATGGLIDARTDGLDARIDNVKDRQFSIERRLDITETRYRARFAALDALLGQLQSTSSFLTNQLSGLQG